MPLRRQIARAFKTAAVFGTFAASYPAIAIEGSWHQDGWYPQGQSPSQTIVSKEPLKSPPVTDQNDEAVMDQDRPNEVKFIQPGREAWLADCRQRIAQTHQNSARENARPTSAQRTAGPDTCEAYLNAHNERYIASIRDWINSSETTRSQVYMPIEYVFEDIPVEQYVARSETKPTRASPNPQLTQR